MYVITKERDFIDPGQGRKRNTKKAKEKAKTRYSSKTNQENVGTILVSEEVESRVKSLVTAEKLFLLLIFINVALLLGNLLLHLFRKYWAKGRRFRVGRGRHGRCSTGLQSGGGASPES